MSYLGLRVGPFEITESVTVPEPGDWYRAERRGLTRRQPTEVLVRVLPPDAAPDERAELQARFESLRNLDDSRIPGAIAFYEGMGALAIAPAFGAPIQRIVAGRADDSIAMNPSTLLDFLLEITESLLRVHAKSRYHAHLSPHNIVLSSQGNLWIFGFGASDAPHPQWLSPEQASGSEATAQTDQWALGAIAAALITGKAPWSEENASEDARRADVNELIDNIERQWPALARLVRRMMAPLPSNRFPSLHPAKQELLALSRKAGGTSTRKELGMLIAPGPRGLDHPEAAAEMQSVFQQEEDIEDPLSFDAVTSAQMDPITSATIASVLEDVETAATEADSFVDEEGPGPPTEPPEIPTAPSREAPEQLHRSPLPAQEEMITVRPDLSHDLPIAGRAGVDANADTVIREDLSQNPTIATDDTQDEEDEDEATVLFNQSEAESFLAELYKDSELDDTPAPAPVSRGPEEVFIDEDEQPSIPEEEISAPAILEHSENEEGTNPTAIPNHADSPAPAPTSTPPQPALVREVPEEDAAEPVDGVNLAPRKETSSGGLQPQMVAIALVGLFAIVGLLWLISRLM